MTAKVVNYTPEQTTALVAAYVAAPVKATVERFAVAFGKTTKSIVAKLSREGVYVKAVRVTKAGEPIVKKNAMVEAIAGMLGVASEKLDGLDTAPKAALALIANALKARKMEAAGEDVPGA